MHDEVAAPRSLASDPPAAVGGAGASAPDADELEVIEPLCAVFRRKLKSEGLKYTPERAQVLDTVMRQDGPFEVERVLQAVRGAGFRVSKATVYRTIKLLLDAGLIQRVLVTQEQSYFQLVWGRRPADLIIRVDTGQFISVEAPELLALRERLCKEHGLSVVSHRLHIFAQGHAEPVPTR